jgi:lipoprotein-anchoring transpeptidase ErfK/SrfK
MQPCLRVALLVSALGVAPAMADPMPLSARDHAAAPVRLASANMGGGFIEFLFSGPRHDGRASYPDNHYGRYPAEPADADAPRDPYARSYPGYARGEPAEASAPARPAMDPRYRRQVVDYHGKEAPGTVIINTNERFLYLVEGNGRAVRYGIGVGRPGFTWAGVKQITMKREWPDWRPPAEMLKRRPDLPRYMPGGPENPLGARAMYLGSSLYRIHGSNEPWTIGQAVSSGCIRMRNEDVVDLYSRVKVGTRVIVI